MPFTMSNTFAYPKPRLFGIHNLFPFSCVHSPPPIINSYCRGWVRRSRWKRVFPFSRCAPNGQNMHPVLSHPVQRSGAKRIFLIFIAIRIGIDKVAVHTAYFDVIPLYVVQDILFEPCRKRVAFRIAARRIRKSITAPSNP